MIKSHHPACFLVPIALLCGAKNHLLIMAFCVPVYTGDRVTVWHWQLLVVIGYHGHMTALTNESLDSQHNG